MLPGPRGRMDVRLRGPPIVRWMAPKGRPEAGNDLQTGMVSGFFGRPAPLLRYANRMSSRFNRGASASALTVRGQPCDFGVSEKLGWTRRRVRDWIKPNPEMPDGNPSPGIRPWARNRSSFTFASQKCFPNHAQARTDAGLRPL